MFLRQDLPNYDMSHEEVVVMALAHMWMVSSTTAKRIRDDVFQALGVEPGKKRKDLMKLAEEFRTYGPAIDHRPADWSFWKRYEHEGILPKDRRRSWEWTKCFRGISIICVIASASYVWTIRRKRKVRPRIIDLQLAALQLFPAALRWAK